MRPDFTALTGDIHDIVLMWIAQDIFAEKWFNHTSDGELYHVKGIHNF